MTWVRLAGREDVKVGGLLGVMREGHALVLCRTGETEGFAVEDACSHDGGSLSDGRLEGYALECPRHGARFDVRSGGVLRPPAAAPIETIPVRLSGDGDWEADLDEEP